MIPQYLLIAAVLFSSPRALEIVAMVYLMRLMYVNLWR